MTAIFPPQGSQDETRYGLLAREDREYSQFCVEFCSGILEMRPGHSEALELAANHFTCLGFYADGLALDQRLAVLKPDDPGVLYNLGCSYALLGKVDPALQALSKAVENGYHDCQHMLADMDLASLYNEDGFQDLVALMKVKYSK